MASEIAPLTALTVCNRKSLRLPLLSLLALVLVTLVATGCANKREAEKSRSEIDRATYLIDQGQFSEAIYTLSEKLKEEPANPQARLLLASAYAGRAGLKFLDFKHFAAQVQSWNGDDDPKLFSSKNKLLQSVAQTIWQIQRFSQAFETVPAPTSKTGLDDLRSTGHSFASLFSSTTSSLATILFRRADARSIFRN
jgi:hypothetical protein